MRRPAWLRCEQQVEIALDRYKDSDMPCRSAWFTDRTMKVYVRFSMRCIGGQRLQSLEIANVAVNRKGKGRFTKFLDSMDRINPWPVLFVECVQSPRFAAFFRKRKWVELNAGEHRGYPSFYKLKEC